MRKVLAALGVLFVMATAVGAMAAPALAQVYPPTSCSLQIPAGTVVTLGGTVTVTGSGFSAGQSVQLRVNGTVATTTTANGSGAISAQVTIPANATSPVVISTTSPACQISVTPGAVGPLAFTGSNTQPLVIIGIAATAIGAVAVVATRRRSSTRDRKLAHVAS